MKGIMNFGNISAISFGNQILTNEVNISFTDKELVVICKSYSDINLIKLRLRKSSNGDIFHINSKYGEHFVTVDNRSAEEFEDPENNTLVFTFAISEFKTSNYTIAAYLGIENSKKNSDLLESLKENTFSLGDEVPASKEIERDTSRDQTNEIIATGFMQNGEMKEKLADAVTSIVSISHALASKSGWWDLPQSVVDAKKVIGLFDSGEITLTKEAYNAIKAQAEWKPNIAEKLCLIHSEVSEAMEGDRKNLFDDHLPDRLMLEVELADAVIRIADLAGYLKLDLGGAVVEKLAYNQQRADHKRENRDKEDGKKY